MTKLMNFWLKIKFKWFKFLTEPIKFNEIPDWEENWKKPSYEIHEDFLYAGHSYCSKDCVEQKENALHLKVLPTNEFREHWSGSQHCLWKIGWVNYQNIFPAYGTWVWEVNLPPNTFCALWFLRPSYPSKTLRESVTVNKIENNNIIYYNENTKIKFRVNCWVLIDGNKPIRIKSIENNKIILRESLPNVNFNKFILAYDSITPEIDIMELLYKNKIAHTIHYGDSDVKYTTSGQTTSLGKPNFHETYEFAVKVSPTKYEFYINGYKTGIMKVGLSEEPINVILNSAMHSRDKDNTVKISDFIIKSFKFYKNK